MSLCGFLCLMDRAYHRGRGRKDRCRKRSFCDDGHQTRSRARAGKSKVQPASPRPCQRHHHTLVVDSDALVLLHHSTPPSRQTPTNHTYSIALLNRLRSSSLTDVNLAASTVIKSYQSAPTHTSRLSLRDHSTHPAKWPISLRLRQQTLTSISQTSTNPRSLRNPSTTRLPPPWIKKPPLLRRCCPLSLAAF